VHRSDFAPYTQASLFGFVDGVNGLTGLIFGLLLAHTTSAIIFTAILARAWSSAISMAGAEYESDTEPASRKVKIGKVAAMGLGYLASAMLPGLGFASSIRAGLAVFIPAVIVVLAVITWFRSGRSGWVKAGLTTVTIFTLAVAAGLLASLAG
jgi:hypothetical protein